jgi:hypothetical protein
MRSYWGTRLCCTTWAFASLASCVLPEVTSTPPDESSAVAAEATVAMSSEPPPADAPTVLASEPESQAEAGAAGEAGAVSRAGAAGETATASQPTAAAAPNVMCFRCDGVFLRKCSDAPNAVPIAECTSAVLCDAKAGKCLSAMCAPNTATCKDNVLFKCNAQGTAYEETVCGSKVCSEAHRSCDLCAMFRECDGDTLVECDATGQSYKRTRCPSSAPYCHHNRCMECVNGTECPDGPSINCLENYCDLGQGICRTRNRPYGDCTVDGSGEQGHCNSNSVCVAGAAP